jgi:hypothetical protein
MVVMGIVSEYAGPRHADDHSWRHMAWPKSRLGTAFVSHARCDSLAISVSSFRETMLDSQMPHGSRSQTAYNRRRGARFAHVSGPKTPPRQSPPYSIKHVTVASEWR